MRLAIWICPFSTPLILLFRVAVTLLSREVSPSLESDEYLVGLRWRLVAVSVVCVFVTGVRDVELECGLFSGVFLTGPGVLSKNPPITFLFAGGLLLIREFEVG